MQHIFLEILLCGLVYTFLIAFIFVKRKNRNDERGSDDDDEGGLPVNFPPDFDLPPGICLPDDPVLKKMKETEETFA